MRHRQVQAYFSTFWYIHPLFFDKNEIILLKYRVKVLRNLMQFFVLLYGSNEILHLYLFDLYKYIYPQKLWKLIGKDKVYHILIFNLQISNSQETYKYWQLLISHEIQIQETGNEIW